MHARTIASISCKIIALFLFIQGLVLLTNMIYLMVSPYKDEFTAFNLLVALGMLLFAVLLYLFSHRIANIMIKAEKAEETEAVEALNADTVQRIAFSVLGLYFMGNSLPSLVSFLLQRLFLITSDGTAIYAPMPGFLFTEIRPIITFIVGLAIFLGSRKLVQLLSRLRGMP